MEAYSELDSWQKVSKIGTRNKSSFQRSGIKFKIKSVKSAPGNSITLEESKKMLDFGQNVQLLNSIEESKDEPTSPSHFVSQKVKVSPRSERGLLGDMTPASKFIVKRVVEEAEGDNEVVSSKSSLASSDSNSLKSSAEARNDN